MAQRHFVAVCVVCLLCAEHLPCRLHVMAADAVNIITSDLEKTFEVQGIPPASDINIPLDNDLYDRRKDKLKHRQKRHAHHPEHSHEHHTTEEMPEVTKIHIEKLINYFSDGKRESMDDVGFDNMISNLKIKDLFSNKTGDTCVGREEFLEKMTHQNHQHDHDHDHSDIKISSDDLLSICPILLYYASIPNSNACLESSNFNVSITEGGSLIDMEEGRIVWLYSTLAVFLVSLCGLFGIAVIPIMDMHIYHHALQFLVALAVGTLAGDALLHLMPHAMMPLHDGQDMHRTMMYRGLAAMAAIVFFYFFERFLVMITEWRQRKEKRDKKSSRVRVMRDNDSASLNGTTTTCKHKYSSYPYCYDEITMDTKDDHHEHQHINNLNAEDSALQLITSQNELKKVNGLLNDTSHDVDNNTLTLSTSLEEGSVESNALCNNNKLQPHDPLSITNSHTKNIDSMPEENYTIILREHQSKHHGHSHTHGHVHSPPESLSAVVWMIILGDGLHNFTDGMAIGAAFSNSAAGGFSTAVAVFCHELPHEIGDFAVLLKAGMSARKAIYYNILSSVLGFFGMCFGIVMGDTKEASQWMFAVTAGLFLYIAFVDMMPELTSSHSKEESCMLSQCFLQFIGMSTGILLMFLIALYEHDLESIFTS